MVTSNGNRLYAGDGTTTSERGISSNALDAPTWLDEPTGYLADPGLADAVNVSLTLGQPLLVTGEPGTGKTQLAASVAHELGLGTPLVFNTKSTSSARDLFYRYDALRHFHDTHFKSGTAMEEYIDYEALGQAIFLACADPPVRSVVLIDEIDKAPRDFANDILNEIEQMEFTIKETGLSLSADRRYRPVVILTSNSERTLPDAFLRRCVFFHIAFPDRERLRGIIQRRLGSSSWFSPERLDQAVAHFERIRELGLRKKPSTAELLGWLRVLDRLHLDVGSPKPGEREAIAMTYSILAKSREDLSLLQERLSQGMLT